MSAIGVQSQINKDRALWLSSIPSDVIHGNILCDTIIANAGYISTLYSDNTNVSTLNVSTLSLTTSDVSGMYVSSLRGNTAFFSSLSLASDLSGGLGYVRFSVDASGIQVDGDPIRFDNLVYLTSSINIIQVSTLVDTDIFGSNGYFSTLSSGTISTGSLQAQQQYVSSLQGNYGSFSSLSVSSLAAIDVSGNFAKNWSQFQTLNSSIVFQPAYILSNVSNKLYFAGQELTDASGGGANWSAFPALQDVSMNNFSLRAISTLQFQDTAKLYSQTGNNLFYNGQPVQYGAASNVSKWANYTAVNNVNMNTSSITNAGNIGAVNLALSGSNITNGNTFTNSLGVGGTSLISLASINSLGQLSCQDIEVSNPAVGLADVNIYGATALPGDSALYVQGGVQFDGGTIHGFSAGVLPVAGVNTGRIDMLQAGFNLLHPLTGAITTGAALGITAGGALSLAGGGYVEMNTSTLQMINTSQGNKNTTIQAGFLTIDPDLAATSSIKLFNTLGGGVEIDGGGQGSLKGFSTLKANYLSSFSTTATTGVFNYIQNSTIFYGFGLGISSVIGALNVNNIKIADDITGVTNAPNPLQSRIINFSSINSFNMSTTDFWVSSINGQPIDASGGTFINTNKFSTLFTSSLRVSTLVGYSYPANSLSTIFVEGGFQFSGDYQGQAFSGRFLSSLRNINSAGEVLTIEGGGTGKEFGIYYPGNTADPWKYIRIGGGSAFDTKIRNDHVGFGEVSTCHVLTSSIIGDPVKGVDVSGNINMNATLNIPLGDGINFDDGSLVNYTRLMRRDVANNNMLAVVNNTTEPAPEQINMMPLGVGELWLTGSSDQYQACRLYSVFPFGNYELDAIDADGATLFAYMQGYENGDGLNPGFLQAYSNVSSISGYDQESAANQMLHVINGLTTSNLIISSINGQSAGSVLDENFSTIYTSSIYFSSAVSVGSNTNFNYPIFIDYDQGGNVNGGVAIAVQGHNLGTGAVRNQIEFGARGDGTNYIMSSWPGQNLEDLVIDATQLTIRDSDGFSTIVNENPYGIATNGQAKFGVGSGVVEISTGLIKVGGQTNLTPTTISTTFMNTPYGNNMYYAGQRQPCIFHGTTTLPSGGAVASSLITLATAYTTKDFDVQLTYKNSYDNTGIYWSTQTTGSFLAFGGQGKILSWTTFGDLPFTG